MIDPVSGTILAASITGAATLTAAAVTVAGTVTAAVVTVGVTVAIAATPGAIRYLRARKTSSLFRKIKKASEHHDKIDEKKLRRLISKVRDMERHGLKLNKLQSEDIASAERALANL
ncbi:hypothetical protein B0J13DRAFT_603123 [Dactylonectria estremocensis]|uniref:Uncharacterized protein n=1 Tax=Dactylonectria estremocensis TaxID=1079267 RepID=A0A9P9FC94_9HYPO|nr:hypothetical protein B0J13DRAFT_603123 [Dactylonectria estremocensis]